MLTRVGGALVLYGKRTLSTISNFVHFKKEGSLVTTTHQTGVKLTKEAIEVVEAHLFTSVHEISSVRFL